MYFSSKGTKPNPSHFTFWAKKCTYIYLCTPHSSFRAPTPPSPITPPGQKPNSTEKERKTRPSFNTAGDTLYTQCTHTTHTQYTHSVHYIAVSRPPVVRTRNERRPYRPRPLRRRRWRHLPIFRFLDFPPLRGEIYCDHAKSASFETGFFSQGSIDFDA